MLPKGESVCHTNCHGWPNLPATSLSDYGRVVNQSPSILRTCECQIELLFIIRKCCKVQLLPYGRACKR